MSAGLPGLGLGGLFFILSALLAPAIEAARIARGRRREGVWPQIWRQFVLALLMIAAIDLTLRAAFAVLMVFGMGTDPGEGVSAIPLKPVVITALVLLCVLLAAKALQLTLWSAARAARWREDRRARRGARRRGREPAPELSR